MTECAAFAGPLPFGSRVTGFPRRRHFNALVLGERCPCFLARLRALPPGEAGWGVLDCAAANAVAQLVERGAALPGIVILASPGEAGTPCANCARWLEAAGPAPGRLRIRRAFLA